MPFPAASGFDQLPNGKFEPEIWSGNLLVNYYEQAIGPAIYNTNYEGEITDFGSKVIIRRKPKVEIRKYRKGMKLETQSVQDEGIEFAIERGLYYNFPVDDVQRKQADINYVEEVTADASIQQALEIDSEIFGATYVDVPDANDLGAVTVAKESGTGIMAVDEFLVKMALRLDKAFVPNDGRRWLVVPHDLLAVIKLNPNFLDASKMGDSTSMIRNGFVGTIDRFRIFGTSLLAQTGSAHHVLAGHPEAITFATQFVKTETLRNPNAFGDLVRGLQVYDFKVTQPTLLATAEVTVNL